jgi:hypothetical protein
MATLTIDFDTNTAIVKLADTSCNMPVTEILTMEEAERRAIQDHKALVGSMIEVEWVHVYDGNDHHTSDKKPFVVKLLNTTLGELINYHDEFLDPRYDATVIEGRGIVDPGAPVWIFGRAYQTKPNA